MTLKVTGFRRDLENPSVESFMDITQVDPYQRFGLQFPLAKVDAGTMASMHQVAMSYEPEDQETIGRLFSDLDLAGVSPTPSVFERVITTYVIAAPARTILPEYRAALIWHVDGARMAAGLSTLLPHEMSDEQLAAIRGMLIQSYVADHCPKGTPYDDYVFAGSHINAIKPLLPELKTRYSIERELVASMIEASSSPLKIGML